jgi:hypothetical protein
MLVYINRRPGRLRPSSFFVERYLQLHNRREVIAAAVRAERSEDVVSLRTAVRFERH